MTETAQKQKRSLLPKAWTVPERFRARLGVEPGRQRIMVADGHLLIVLHAPPKHGDEARVGRFFWRDPQGAWRSSEKGSGTAALAGHLEDFEKAIDALEAEERKAETAEELFKVIRELTPLARTTRNLHQTLQQAREAVPDDGELIPLRDEAYSLERQSELVLVSAKDALGFRMARQAEEQAREAQRTSAAAHRLNALAALFLPTGTAAAVLSMNLRHGFEDTPAPYGFLAVLGVGMLSGFILRALLNRP